MFQIVRCILADDGEVTLREPLQPLFELWEDATAMAEFDSSRLSDDYGYDEARECWWGSDSRGRMYRFEVEQVAAAVGYQDATALRRLMRKVGGATPSQFRSSTSVGFP